MLTQTTAVKWCAECGSNFVLESDDQKLCKICSAKPAAALELAAPRIEPVMPRIDPIVKAPIAAHEGSTRARRIRRAKPKPEPKLKPARQAQPVRAAAAGGIYTLTDKAIAIVKPAAEPAQSSAPASSAHWHFRTTDDGRPTGYYPTRRAPNAPHVVKPALDGEKQRDAWDRFCDVDEHEAGARFRWRQVTP